MISLFRAKHCPRCVGELVEVEKQLHALQAENQQLRQALAMFQTTPAETVSAPQIAYVASWNRKHFHRADCTWIENLSKEKLREFSSHEEAVKAGYRPCKTCCA